MYKAWKRCYGVGGRGDLENCAYFWKKPGYAPALETETAVSRVWIVAGKDIMDVLGG